MHATWREEVDEAKQAAVCAVENAIFRAATQPDASGKINAVAGFFFLCNRAKDRWRHVNRVEVSGPEGGAQTHFVKWEFDGPNGKPKGDGKGEGD
jgi:hypothetical protein